MALVLVAMVAALGFHFVYCLVPSLRYFDARASAFVLGVVAYLAIALPPLIDAVMRTGLADTPAYLVIAFAVLTVAAWRPYAFVRATGGPATAGVDESREGSRGPERAPFVEPATLDRPLSDDEAAALRWILEREDAPGAEALWTQVPHVWVTDGRTTEMTFEVRGAAPAPVPDGVLPVQALVVDAHEEAIGHISVWVREGYLDSLEYSWFTDDPPTEYPSPDRLRPFDPSA